MLTDEDKIRHVEALLDGGKRVHCIFCNFSRLRDPRTCPTCKDLILTDTMSEDEVWDEISSYKRKSSSG